MSGTLYDWFFDEWGFPKFTGNYTIPTSDEPLHQPKCDCADCVGDFSNATSWNGED